VRIEIETPRGPAAVHLHEPEQEPPAAMILGHGAAGGVSAPDLQAVTAAALADGLAVALVEQPYRVAGRRSPPPAAHLDEAWIAVVEELRAGALSGLELIVGGRSSGTRVACRTVADTKPVAVMCLAFPLIPPGRSRTGSRQNELDAVSVPTLVVQGAQDPFGIPAASAKRTVVTVRGNHSLRTDLDAVVQAVREWLHGTGFPAFARRR
jgi:hypothetical protein